MLAWSVVPEWAFMKTRNPCLTAAFARKIETLKKPRCKPQGSEVFRWGSMGIYAESINPEVAGGTSCVDLQKSVVKVLTDGTYLTIAEYCAGGRFPIFYYWIVGAIVREWVAPCV
jgi:hypothetical protein